VALSEVYAKHIFSRPSSRNPEKQISWFQSILRVSVFSDVLAPWVWWNHELHHDWNGTVIAFELADSNLDKKRLF